MGGPPRKLSIEDPFADRGGIVSPGSWPFVMAPAPSGGDDYAALHAAVLSVQVSGLRLVLQLGTYQLSANPFTVAAGSAPVDIVGIPPTDFGGPWVGTTLKAIAPMRAVLEVLSAYSNFSNLIIDANRLATYGVYFESATSTEFNRVWVRNATLDGFHSGSVGVNQGITLKQCRGSYSGKTFATAAIVGQYPNNTVRQAAIAGTAAIVSGNNVITITGGPDITTLGIRVGDMVRVGAVLSTCFNGQIASVAHVGAGNDTITLQPAADNRPSSTASGLDFAILIGWGWYTEQYGGNGFNFIEEATILRGNGCGGMLMGSLYGDHVRDAVIDANNCAGIAMGFLFNAGSVFEPLSDGVYMESNLGPDYVLGNTLNAKIDTPGGGSAIFSIGYLECQGLIIRGGVAESMQFGVEQNFLVEVRDFGPGAIQHRIVADHIQGNGAAQATKVVGNSLNWVNTPTVNNVTDFMNGVGLYDAGGVLEILLNVGRTQSVNAAPAVAIEFDSTGTAHYALSTIAVATNVNGILLNRPAIFISDVNGNIPSITTGTLGGKTIGIRVRGQFR